MEIEAMVYKLEEIDHGIEDIFSSAKDLKNPSEDTIRLYVQCILTYSPRQILEIHDSVDAILEARNLVEEYLLVLGFDFGVDNLYEGLLNFSTLLEKICGEIRSFTKDGDDFESIDISCCNIQDITSKAYGSLSLSRKERNLTKGIIKITSELSKYIHDGGTICLKAYVNQINSLFRRNGLCYEGEMCILEIDENGNINTPYVSNIRDERYFTISHKQSTTSIVIDRELSILFDILKFFNSKDTFYRQINTLHPEDELFQKLEEDKGKYGAKGAYLRFLKAYFKSQKNKIECVKNESSVGKLMDLKEIFSNFDTNALNSEMLEVFGKVKEVMNDDNDN